jgi:Protein of unknown function (DUF2934)
MADIGPVSNEQRIRERAYEIYLSRNGNGEGDELSDWLTAERELKLNSQQPELPSVPRRSARKTKAVAA